MLSTAPDLGNNWGFTEVWVDPTSVPPYVLMLLGDEEKEQLNYLTYYHPNPRVRRKMEVLWLKSQNLNHKAIAKWGQ
ncbi:MAG: hypothetical protein AB4352_20895 [Hormoscilla sp.]